MRHASAVALSFFAVLAALAVSASCGSKPPCGITNCGGCCDAAGMCHDGSAVSACGENGTLCKDCGALASCTLGSCVPISGTGGGTAGTGGGSTGSCSPSNCAGCCALNGTCMPGNTTSSCGRSGDVCESCSSGQACSQGACVTTGSGGGSAQCAPSNCAGCCNGANQCVVSPSNGHNTTCGAAGNTCVDCTLTSQTCSSSFHCTGGTGGGAGGGCNSGNCAGGCCAGTICIPATAQTEQDCGLFGNTCAACNGGLICSAGTCQAGGTGGGAGGGCMAVSLSGTIAQGFYNPNPEVTATLKHPATSTYNEATYELWWTPTVPTLPHTENFSTASKYNSCEACVTYQESCSATAACSGRFFFAQSGSITVNTASRADAGVMSGSATAMTLQEWDTTNDQPVSGGACVTLPATSFSVSF